MDKNNEPMNMSTAEAEESLAAIQNIAQKTRQSIASGGTYITLIVTGIVWMIGFICTQFLPKEIVGYIWATLSIIGGIIGTFLGIRMGKRVRSPATTPTAKRVILFWLFLFVYGVTIISIAHPTDGKQATLFVILFIMLGQLAMGMLFSFSSVWWASGHCPGFGRLFLAAGNFLPLDGCSGWGRDDPSWPIYSFKMVKHGSPE